MDSINALDTMLFHLINGIGNPFLDPVMMWLSDKYIWIPLYLYIIFRLYQKEGKQFWIPIVVIIIVITLCDQVTSSFMKPYFQRLRPCKDPEMLGQLIQVGKCGGKYGFASSHAANTMGLAVFIFLYEHRSKFSWVMLLWAFFVGVSRVYLGVHFPGDVIVGFLVGGLFAFSLEILSKKIRVFFGS